MLNLSVKFGIKYWKTANTMKASSTSSDTAGFYVCNWAANSCIDKSASFAIYPSNKARNSCVRRSTSTLGCIRRIAFKMTTSIDMSKSSAICQAPLDTISSMRMIIPVRTLLSFKLSLINLPRPFPTKNNNTNNNFLCLH